MEGKTSKTSGSLWVDLPPSQWRTSEWLSSRLEDRILGGELAIGMKLPSERALAEGFQLSRPVVREALRRLEERGLVEVAAGRGAFVKESTTWEAAGQLERLYRRTATPRQLVEVRRMLETEAAALAAIRADAKDIQLMDAALERFDQSRDPVVAARNDLLFHLSVVRGAHNPLIESMFGSISRLTVGLMFRSLIDSKVARAGVPFHREIVDAIRVHDPDLAREVVAGHLRVGERLYGEDYDTALADVTERETQRLLGTALTFDDLLSFPASDAEPDRRIAQ